MLSHHEPLLQKFSIRDIIACNCGKNSASSCSCAYKSALETIRKDRLGVCKIACGTGKTRLICALARDICLLSTSRSVPLIVMPTLALLRDFTKNYWEFVLTFFEVICVSSDEDIRVDGSGDDNATVQTTTDPKTINRFLDISESPLILSTYASLSKTLEIVSERNRVSEKETPLIGLFDEAHHVAEKNIASVVFPTSKSDSLFSHRIFFTATPLLNTKNGVNMTGDRDKKGADCDRWCGEHIFSISFVRARDADILKPFNIVVGVNDDQTIYPPVKNIKHVQLFERVLQSVQKTGSSEILVFTRFARKSESTTANGGGDSSTHFAADDLGTDTESLSQALLLPSVSLISSKYPGGVDLRLIRSSDSPSVSSRKIDEFERDCYSNRTMCFNSPENKKRVLILVSCEKLNEGIDTKASTAVCFADPFRSRVKIIQRVGRVLRKISECDTQEATIILNVSLKDSKDGEEPSLDGTSSSYQDNTDEIIRRQSSSFEPLLQVLASMSHDDREVEKSILADCRFSNSVEKINTSVKSRNLRVKSGSSTSGVDSLVEASKVSSPILKVSEDEETLDLSRDFSLDEIAKISGVEKIVVHNINGGEDHETARVGYFDEESSDLKQEIHVARDVETGKFYSLEKSENAKTTTTSSPTSTTTTFKKITSKIQCVSNNKAKTGLWDKTFVSPVLASLTYEFLEKQQSEKKTPTVAALSKNEQLALDRAAKFVDFYREHGNERPKLVLGGKNKEERSKASTEKQLEHDLAWFFMQNRLAKRRKRMVAENGTAPQTPVIRSTKLYESVDEFLTKNLGHDWENTGTEPKLSVHNGVVLETPRLLNAGEKSEQTKKIKRTIEYIQSSPPTYEEALKLDTFDMNDPNETLTPEMLKTLLWKRAYHYTNTASYLSWRENICIKRFLSELRRGETVNKFFCFEASLIGVPKSAVVTAVGKFGYPLGNIYYTSEHRAKSEELRKYLKEIYCYSSSTSKWFPSFEFGRTLSSIGSSSCGGQKLSGAYFDVSFSPVLFENVGAIVEDLVLSGVLCCCDSGSSQPFVLSITNLLRNSFYQNTSEKAFSRIRTVFAEFSVERISHSEIGHDPENDTEPLFVNDIYKIGAKSD